MSRPFITPEAEHPPGLRGRALSRLGSHFRHEKSDPSGRERSCHESDPGFFAYPPEKVYSRHYPVVTDGAEGVSPR